MITVSLFKFTRPISGHTAKHRRSVFVSARGTQVEADVSFRTLGPWACRNSYAEYKGHPHLRMTVVRSIIGSVKFGPRSHDGGRITLVAIPPSEKHTFMALLHPSQPIHWHTPSAPSHARRTPYSNNPSGFNTPSGGKQARSTLTRSKRSPTVNIKTPSGRAECSSARWASPA